jgi:glycosyltransferase involved in cell wall biosynthesis
MRIALLSPIAWRTPPTHYGPWEQVVSNLMEGLVKLNVEVTLFATGNSITAGPLVSVCDEGYAENNQLNAKVLECLHISHMMEQAHDFDLIHNHFDFLPLTYSALIKTPMMTTIHGFSSPQIIPVYQKYNSTSKYVSISNADRHPTLAYVDTVYNGINPAAFTFRNIGKEYLLFFGRIHPEKGTYEAIQIALKAKRKLIISGLIQDQVYFREKVEPYLNEEDIVYVGNSGPEVRDVLLGEALALLHPISFAEPFGLSVAEAMMCGTPVVAFDLGAMQELIVDGQTGFLVHTIDEAVTAVQNIAVISRAECSAWARKKFSSEVMTAHYVRLYEEWLSK